MLKTGRIRLMTETDMPSPAPTRARVRVAMPEDAPGIMGLLREMHAETGVFSLSENRVLEIIQRAFNKGGATIGVIGAPGKLEASICMMIANMYYSDDFYLEDMWNFVRKDYRKSNNAKELLRFATRCSDETGLIAIVGVTSTKDTQRKIDLYAREFGEQIGAAFIHYPTKAA